MPEGEKAPISRVMEAQKKPAVKIRYKKTDQTHLVCGTRAFDQFSEKRFTLSLLSIILGGNMSSRMFIEVREKRGLAYSIRTSTESFDECGYIETQAGVEHKNLALTVETIMNEYKKIRTEKVSDKELQMAKDFIKGKMVMGMESSDEVAMFHVGQELSRREILKMEDILAKINKVTVDDIQAVAQEIFLPERMNLAVIGPHKGNANSLKKLLEK